MARYLKNYGLTDRQKRFVDTYQRPGDFLWKLFVFKFPGLRRKHYGIMSRLFRAYFDIMDTINFGWEST